MGGKVNAALPKSARRYVESELGLYAVYVAALEQRIAEMHDVARPEVSSRDLGDPTGAEAVRLAMLDDDITSLRRRISRIEAGLQCLTPAERDIIETRYMSGCDYNNDEVISALRMDRHRYYGLRWNALHKLGIVFGVAV